MIKLLIISLLSLTVFSAIRSDLVHRVPGYGDHFQTNVYAGYLNTSDSSRRMFYVFVEAASNVNNSDPVTLWLNGGPGCSSLLGFLQQIGPFHLQSGKNYTNGDNLTQNKHSWHHASNLLFIQSPAGVGYSINTNSSFQYNDLTTMNDNFDALRFFFTYYPEYSKNHFWIAGQSYAGKYIPDLAFRIDHWNLEHSTPEDQKIKLEGIIIGNGIMDLSGDELLQSEIEYMIDHEFIDPELIDYWTNACQVDPNSAGCNYFLVRFMQNIDEINDFNVYGYCYYNDTFQNSDLTQQSILLNIARTSARLSESQTTFKVEDRQNNGVPCSYLEGVYQYFMAHGEEFHAQKQWNGPCAREINEKYLIGRTGSMNQYRYLFSRSQDIHIVMYNGDWDSVVPFTDTIKNLEKLNLKDEYLYTPMILNGQHVGFTQLYSGMNFVVVKGASHQASMTKRQATFDIFETALKSHGKKKEEAQL